MKLVTINRPPAGRAGLMIGDEILDIGMAGSLVPLAGWAPASLIDILAAGDEGVALLRRLNHRAQSASDAVKDELRTQGCPNHRHNDAAARAHPAPWHPAVARPRLS